LPDRMRHGLKMMLLSKIKYPAIIPVQYYLANRPQ